MLTATLLKSWARNDVWRCGVESPRGALPASVIVKRCKGEPERGFDEWAALAFLTGQVIEPPHAGGAPPRRLPPSLLAADQPWAPGVSARRAVLWHLGRFHAVASNTVGLAPLVDTLARLAGALNARWAVEHASPFIWPAFRQAE